MTLNRLRRMITENWGLKLLSLAFATLLWMFVVGEKRSEVSLSVPLELTRVPPDRVIVSPVPEAIRVRLNGPRTLLAAIDPNKLVITLDLDGIQPGISAFEILPSRLNLPRGVDVTYISPSVVTLEADRKVRKTVAVKPRIRGTPAEGFEVAGVTVEPTTVTLEGAERVLKGLKEIPTEPVDVTGLDGSVSRPVALAMPDPTVRLVEPVNVRLSVEIRKVVAEREFMDVPVPVPEPGWRARPAGVRVRLRGSLTELSRLTASDLRVRVDPVPEPPAGRVRVRVEVPAGMEVLGVDPEVVQMVPPPAQAPPAGAKGSKGGEQ